MGQYSDQSLDRIVEAMERIADALEADRVTRLVPGTATSFTEMVRKP